MKTATKAIQVLESLKVPTGVDSAEVEETKREVTKVYDFAEAIAITDNKSLTSAEAFARACSDHEKKVKKTFERVTVKLKESKKAASDAYAEMNAFIDLLIGPVTEAKRLADTKARVFRDEEQKRLATENERKRQEAMKAAEEKRQAEIAALKEAGTREAKDAARRLKEEPIEPVRIIEEKLPDAVGVVHREAWTCEADFNLTKEYEETCTVKLIQAAATDIRLARFLMPNMVTLNAEARTMKEKFCVPGFLAVNRGATAHR
jgi:hypothetical protein